MDDRSGDDDHSDVDDDDDNDDEGRNNSYDPYDIVYSIYEKLMNYNNE